MKIKKIKLLKALALTGAFGIVATVPVIVSSCSSTDNGGSGNNTDGNGNQGGNQDQNGDGGSGDSGQQQNKTIKPEIKSDVNLSGALSNIYGTDSKTTNQLIADDIKANPENYFTNGSELKDVINQTTVTVDGGFSASEWNSGNDYATWSTGTTKVTYPTAAPQIDIASLNDLKQTTFKDDAAIQAFLTAAKLTFSGASNYTVENKLSLSSGDLLHVNVKADRASASGGNLNLDLQIPVSNINLKANLKVSVTATNNATGTNIEAVSDLTTSFNYNIGIKDTVDFTQPTNKPTIASGDKTNAMKALEALGYTVTGNANQLDSDKVSAALGVYNCSFKVSDSNPITEDSQTTGRFTIKLQATPESGYVWEDGTGTAKEISFTVDFTVQN